MDFKMKFTWNQWSKTFSLYKAEYCLGSWKGSVNVSLLCERTKTIGRHLLERVLYQRTLSLKILC